MADFSMKSLPVGFRFKPKDTELIDYYLRQKINGNAEEVKIIREIDICKWEPWELPDFSVLETDDMEWFFFCPINRRYSSGQRRERATAKGYWKSTGKDRKIKKRTCVIGMKKSLVFHEKCVPKPRKTDWKIHEYSTTSPELDGTHPGQGAYVLCRLFKDGDEKSEVSQDDEVEPDISSPTTPKCSPEGMQSELAQETPVLAMPVEQLTNYGSCQEENFDRMTPNTQVPDDCHSNSYKCNNADDQVAEGTATEVDPQLEEDMDLLYVPLLDEEECRFLSSFGFQVPTEQGSYYMHTPFNDDFSNGHNGPPLQCGTNEQDVYISKFFASVFKDPDENCVEEPCSQKGLTIDSEAPKTDMPVSQNVVSIVEDSQSCSESDPEAAQAQLQALAGKDSLQMETTDEDRQTSSHINAVRNGDGIGNGIRIRTRPPENQSGNRNTFNQGTATRRNRLQRRLEVGPLFSSGMSKLSFSAEYPEAKSTVTEVSHASNQEVTVNMGLKLRSRSNVPKGRDENIPSAFCKTPLKHCSVFSSVYTLRVVVVVVVLIIFVGIYGNASNLMLA